MTDKHILYLKGFYENELVNHILAFWLPRCEDKEYGGFVNCFDNEGKILISHDKYTWSQGRFVWMFSRLSTIKAPIFSKSQRREFLRLAKNGSDFLIKHCLMNAEELDSADDSAEPRCTFLMDRDGTHKYVDGYNELDMSIYADCFVVIGMAAYACASGDEEAYCFGKKIYESILERVEKGTFKTLPYPLSANFRAHGIPMILSNVTKEMYDAAKSLDPEYTDVLKHHLDYFVMDILHNFADETSVIREVIASDNQKVNGLLGQHINPGHTLEDMWFMMDAAEVLDQPPVAARAMEIAKKTLEVGWDPKYGGILHYADVDGRNPETVFSSELLEECELYGEPTEKQVIGGWGDKLWWVHSEALYTTLLCYLRSRDKQFWDWHEKIVDYAFKTFPNRDPEIREWKQICMRDGRPQEKVVALPVKDPFHITRNLILILELLYTPL